jgi:hypothetical protein
VEENAIDDLFVIESDGGDLLGEGKDHVEVLGGQQFGSAVLDPVFASQALALGAAAVPAGAVLNVGVLAVVAPFDAAAQHRRTAGFDGLHQAVLMQGQIVGLPVRWAVLSKDVGQLQSWLGQGLRLAFALAAPSGIAIQVVERADGGRHDLRAHLGVTLGGGDAAVAEQGLNDPDIGAVLQKMGSKTVA